jgi:putative colanic acid biosynthesis UDP-glucose lipid carrier transferase
MSRLDERSRLRALTARVAHLRRLLDATLIACCLVGVSLAFHHDWTWHLGLSACSGALAFLAWGEAQRLYASWRLRSLDDEFHAVLIAWGATCVTLATIAFVLEARVQYSRVASVVWFLATPALLVGARLAARAVLGWSRRRGSNARTVAVAGASGRGQRIVEQLLRTAEYGLRVRIYDDRSTERVLTGKELSIAGPYAGSFSDMLTAARRGDIDYVFIALPMRAEARVTELVNRLADTTASVYVIPDLFISELMRARWVLVGGMPAVSLYESPFDGLNGGLKRLEDLVLGSVLLAVVALPMAVIAMAIVAGSPGPALFRQRRYGLNGKVVQVLKFRTMTCTEDGPCVAQATHNDSRVTPLGRFLRSSSLDELPQLFNVLRGDMSLVGPRPHAVAHNEAYRRRIHGYMLRHKVKPGITGWAQVNGWRGETETLDKMRHRVDHDLEYVRNWSLGLDLRILASTVSVVLSRRNAY